MAQNWAFVQGANVASFTPSGTATAYPSNVVAGNKLLVFVLHNYTGCPPSISDSQGNTYTKVVDRTTPIGAAPYLSAFEAIAGSSGANSVTITYSCGNLNAMWILEYSNMQTSAFDVTNNFNNTSNPALGGSVTTTAADDLVISVFSSNLANAYSSPSGTIRAAYATGNALQDQDQSTAGAVNPSITGTPAPTVYSTKGWTIAFKQVAAAAGGMFRRAFLDGLSTSGPKQFPRGE